MIRLSIVALLLLGACRTAPTIEGFNSQEWKEDVQGCKGKRSVMVEAIKTAKPQLLQISEQEVREMFGTPDNVELFSRSQKFYLYYFEPGQQCAGQSQEKPVRTLEISLDAIGRLHEINIRQ